MSTNHAPPVPSICRLLFGSAAAVLLTLSISACGDHLTVLGEDIPSTDAYETISEEYERRHNLSVEFVANNYETMVNKANTDLSSETGTYDIILQYNTALAPYVTNRWVYPVDSLASLAGVTQDSIDRITEGLFEASWREVGWYPQPGANRASPAALPFAANTMVLVYNATLFEDPVHQDRYQSEYGRPLAVPQTWTEFRDIAEYFTQPNNGLYGLALQGGQYWIYYEWANIAFSMGGGVMAKNWGWESGPHIRLALRDSATVAATEFYRSLRPFDIAGEDFFSRDAVGQRELIAQGNIAMGILWSDVAFGLTNRTGQSTHRLDFAPIPGDVSMLAGGSFYINHASRQPALAASFVLDMMSKENQKELMLSGLCSPRRDVYDDPEVQQEIPYAAAVGESLERGTYMLEAGPEADQVIVAISNALQEIFRRDIAEGFVEQRLDEAAQEIEVERTRIYGNR